MSPTPPVQFRMPPDLLRRIDAAATRAGQSRSAWVFEACERRLAEATARAGK